MKRFATSALIALAALPALSGEAQVDAGRPRLVVGIVVDQLRTDYIEYLQDYFGERGFRSMFADGVYIRDVDFKVPHLDAANATAMLYTGAYPAHNGVPASMVSDPNPTAGSAGRPPLVSTSSGTINNDSFSPENLRLSTIADEIAIDGGGTARIWSVAMDPQQAVIMSGHAGTGALWVNNSSGNWATTSYYGSLPPAASNRNMRNALSQRIDTMVWTPSGRLMLVPGLPQVKRQVPFRHTFTPQDRDVYKKFAASPLSNREVTDVAIELLESQNLGRRSGETDMLNIAYTLAPFKYVKDGVTRTELTDSYLRLDGQLARLFDAIDRSVGRGNAVIWLCSTGYFDDLAATEPKYRIPGGEFSTRRARSLLNSYLSAKFGAAEYVTAIRDGQVYFDKRTLDSGRIDSEKLVADARSFLIKMSGVADALTIDEILSPAGAESEALRLQLDPRSSGEIILRFTPGWDIVYDEQMPPVTKQSREAAVMTPAFIIAPGLKPKTVSTPIEATALAPTVAGALRIRAPNGARTRAIDLNQR